MFSLSFLALLTLTVLGVEYTSASSTRRNLQDALDSALLAAALQQIDDENQRLAYIKAYIGENFESKDALGSLDLVVTEDKDGALSGVAFVDQELFFGGLFPADHMRLGVSSQVRRQASALDAMLVLDVTGSMAGAKLAALKTATSNFLDTVFEGENVKVGIVPFSRYVNIGLGNRNLAGFSIPPDTKSCSIQTVKVGNTKCTGFVWATCYNDGTPYACKKNTGCTTTYTYQTKNVCNTQTWSGCVGSREPPLNAQDSSPNVLIPGLMNTGCNASTLMRLTDQKAALKTAVKNFSASGETYLPGGLMMGWHALTPRDPLPDGTPYTVDQPPMRAIVLMTDGENTASKTNGKPDHNGSNGAVADTLTAKLCENVKADGIYLVTVAFEVTDAATKAMLEDCATTPDDAYQAEGAAELNKTFEDIVGKLSRLRLSK